MRCALVNKVEQEMRIAKPRRRYVLSECLLLLSGTTLASRGSCQLNSQGVKHSLLDLVVDVSFLLTVVLVSVKETFPRDRFTDPSSPSSSGMHD